jgi:hypothetical protein
MRYSKIPSQIKFLIFLYFALLVLLEATQLTIDLTNQFYFLKKFLRITGGVLMLMITFSEIPVINTKRVRLAITGWKVVGTLFIITGVMEIISIWINNPFRAILTSIFMLLLSITIFLLAIKLPELLLFSEVQVIRAKVIYEQLMIQPVKKESLILDYIQSLPQELFTTQRE